MRFHRCPFPFPSKWISLPKREVRLLYPIPSFQPLLDHDCAVYHGSGLGEATKTNDEENGCVCHECYDVEKDDGRCAVNDAEIHLEHDVAGVDSNVEGKPPPL